MLRLSGQAIEKSQLFEMFLQHHKYSWFWIPWWANCYKYIFLDFRDGLKCGVDNCRRLQPYISTFEAADDCCYDPGILFCFFHFIAFLSVYPLISPLSLYLSFSLSCSLLALFFLNFVLISNYTQSNLPWSLGKMKAVLEGRWFWQRDNFFLPPTWIVIIF